MKMSRKRMKLLGAFLSVLMLLVTIPQQSLFAAMVETEVVLEEEVTIVATGAGNPETYIPGFKQAGINEMVGLDLHA